MADTEPTRTVTLTDAEVEALRDAMRIAFSEYERDPDCQDMIAAFPAIRAKLNTAQDIQETSR